MSHPSGDTTIPDELYFATQQAGSTPQTNREAFVRAVTTGPVEQQLVNIASALYDTERKLEKRMDRLEEKVDKRMDMLENLLRGFIAETQAYFQRPKGT